MPIVEYINVQRKDLSTCLHLLYDKIVFKLFVRHVGMTTVLERSYEFQEILRDFRTIALWDDNMACSTHSITTNRKYKFQKGLYLILKSYLRDSAWDTSIINRMPYSD